MAENLGDIRLTTETDGRQMVAAAGAAGTSMARSFARTAAGAIGGGAIGGRAGALVGAIAGSGGLAAGASPFVSSLAIGAAAVGLMVAAVGKVTKAIQRMTKAVEQQSIRLARVSAPIAAARAQSFAGQLARDMRSARFLEPVLVEFERSRERIRNATSGVKDGFDQVRASLVNGLQRAIIRLLPTIGRLGQVTVDAIQIIGGVIARFLVFTAPLFRGTLLGGLLADMAQTAIGINKGLDKIWKELGRMNDVYGRTLVNGIFMNDLNELTGGRFGTGSPDPHKFLPSGQNPPLNGFPTVP